MSQQYNNEYERVLEQRDILMEALEKIKTVIDHRWDYGFEGACKAVDAILKDCAALAKAGA